MNRTEQEKRLETILFELIKNAGNMLHVEFISGDASYRGNNEPKKSVAYIDNGWVILKLVEPITQTELDQWGNVILEAEIMVGKIENERIYEYQNPNFFKAMSSKFYHMYIKK